MDANKILVEVKIKTIDMFEFLMKHIYGNFAGVFGLIFSGIALLALLFGMGRGDKLRTGLLLLAALLFTVIQPLQLLIKAKQQVSLNPMFKDSLQYEFEKEHIVVNLKTAGESIEFKWSDIVKISETKRSVLIYMSSVGAYILPKEQCDGQLEALKNMIRQNMEQKQCKLKA